MASLVCVPSIHGLGKTVGVAESGKAILDALDTFHSTERGNPIDLSAFSRTTFSLSSDSITRSIEQIYDLAAQLFLKEHYPPFVFLGGDHHVSYPLVKAFLHHCRREEKTPKLIVFDAHADLMTPTKEPTHEEWLRALIEAGFPSEHILLVGVRNMWNEEITYLESSNISTISLHQLDHDLEGATDAIMEFAHGDDTLLYVSLDIDVLDPAFAPATGCPEPGGVSSRALIYILSRLKLRKNLHAFDLVEINFEKDAQYGGATTRLGAKLLAELLF